MTTSPGSTAEPSTIASSATVPKQAPETSTPRTSSPSWASSPPGISIPASSAPRARPTPISSQTAGSALVDRDVVEHRQRLGADADHVVDVHRHAVDPDRVEAPQLLGDEQLGADPVGGERDPGPLVDPDHARVVARQRHLPRGPARAGSPPAPAPARPRRNPPLPGRPRPSRRRRSLTRAILSVARQVGCRLEDILAAVCGGGSASPGRRGRRDRSERSRGSPGGCVAWLPKE